MKKYYQTLSNLFLVILLYSFFMLIWIVFLGLISYLTIVAGSKLNIIWWYLIFAFLIFFYVYRFLWKGYGFINFFKLSTNFMYLYVDEKGIGKVYKNGEEEFIKWQEISSFRLINLSHFVYDRIPGPPMLINNELRSYWSSSYDIEEIGYYLIENKSGKNIKIPPTVKNQKELVKFINKNIK